MNVKIKNVIYIISSKNLSVFHQLFFSEMPGQHIVPGQAHSRCLLGVYGENRARTDPSKEQIAGQQGNALSKLFLIISLGNRPLRSKSNDFILC